MELNAAQVHVLKTLNDGDEAYLIDKVHLYSDIPKMLKENEIRDPLLECLLTRLSSENGCDDWWSVNYHLDIITSQLGAIQYGLPEEGEL